MPGSFELDPQLEADSIALAELTLCTVRLMNDANYPWLLMVPKRADLAEIIDLGVDARGILMEEIAFVSEALKGATGCLKLNVAALGNMVRQLHVHIIARFEDDPAWPGPVWGKVAAKEWDPAARERLVGALSKALGA
ncbi:MAG: diadenosine tetraphosphate hydrolase [Hyphomicrobiales bacterium]|nr:MAG: diadenosine tetraphosphate hydrolase [Hyphomicrobiales bacterium]